MAKVKIVDNEVPAFMLIFLGAMLGLLIVGFLWGYYEHGADKRYYDCMYDFAEGHCNLTGVEWFSARHSAVICYPESATGFYIPKVETEERQPYIFSNTHVGICWNRSRSLFHQLETKPAE